MHYSTAQRALRITVFGALLSAISIITGKYLAFNVGEFIRFSFENLPIIFAGLAFGPIVGALVGVVADLVGCMLVAYAINPIITVGAAVIGLISGLVRFLPEIHGRHAHLFKIIIAVFVSHLVGSVIIKSFGLSVFYDLPIIMLMLWRLLNYVIVGSLEGFILYHLMKNKTVELEIRRIMKGKNKK